MSPVQLRGLFQGAFGAAWGLSAFAGPLPGGWVYQHFGAGALWSGCLILGAFLALGYLALGRRASRAGMGASMARAPSLPPTPLPQLRSRFGHASRRVDGLNPPQS